MRIDTKLQLAKQDSEGTEEEKIVVIFSASLYNLGSSCPISNKFSNRLSRNSRITGQPFPIHPISGPPISDPPISDPPISDPPISDPLISDH